MTSDDGGELPPGLASPARRALANAGVTRLEDLTGLREDDLRKLHGIGPKAIDQLRAALTARRMSFAGTERSAVSVGELRKPQDPMNVRARTRITQVGTVGVGITDQDRALAFYAARLGFETRLDVPYGDGERWIEVAPPRGATTIALVLRRESRSTGAETGIRFTTDDAAADHADLRARGVDTDPEVRRGPGAPAMFAFRDPDGNRFVIVERR